MCIRDSHKFGHAIRALGLPEHGKSFAETARLAAIHLDGAPEVPGAGNQHLDRRPERLARVVIGCGQDLRLLQQQVRACLLYTSRCV